MLPLPPREYEDRKGGGHDRHRHHDGLRPGSARSRGLRALRDESVRTPRRPLPRAGAASAEPAPRLNSATSRGRTSPARARRRQQVVGSSRPAPTRGVCGRRHRSSISLDSGGGPMTDGVTGRPLSRRRLLQIGAVGAAGAVAAGKLPAAEAKETKPPPLRFLTKWEFALVTAMAETIWPTDDLGPGAREAGVGYYIDGQLASGWGQGHRTYMNGPFFVPTDSGHGIQIPMTPADLYRAFLPAIDQYARTTYGGPYETLDAANQTKLMNELRAGTASVALAGSTAFTSASFFTMFRQNVLE